MKKGNKKGFSLIELMVVIAIIGILATAGINMYSSYQAKARDSKRITSLNSIVIGLQGFYTDKGFYPAPTAGNGNAEPNGKCLSTDQGKVNADLTDYFDKKNLPVDPSNRIAASCNTNKSFAYKTIKKDDSSPLTNTAYVLAANVEDVNNSNLLYVDTESFAQIQTKLNDKNVAANVTARKTNSTGNNVKNVVYAISE